MHNLDITKKEKTRQTINDTNLEKANYLGDEKKWGEYCELWKPET